MPVRLAAAVLALLALAGGSVAHAARVTLAAGTVAAGTATVGECDTAITASITTAGTSVTGVTVSDVAAACAGGTLVATLTQSGSPLASLSPVVVPAGGGSVLLAVPAPQPSTASVTDVRVVVVGP